MIWIAVSLSLMFAYSLFLTVLLLGQAALLRRVERDQRTLTNFVSALCTPGNFEIAYVPKRSEERKSSGSAN